QFDQILEAAKNGWCSRAYFLTKGAPVSGVEVDRWLEKQIDFGRWMNVGEQREDGHVFFLRPLLALRSIDKVVEIHGRPRTVAESFESFHSSLEVVRVN